MTETDWSRSKVEKLVEMGRSGESWNDVGPLFRISNDAVRHKWYQVASDDDRKTRDDSIRAENKRYAKMMAADRAPATVLEKMPDGVRFIDDPAALKPEIGGKRPLIETWVPYQTPLA